MSRPQDYEAAARQLLKESGCTVRHWRTSNSGTAYTSDTNWEIETPRPRGPMSFGVFAHEVAHQMKHRRNSAPRWLEEIEAWEWAFEQFERFGLPGADKIRPRVADSIWYAIAKACRRARHKTALAIDARLPQWVWDAEQPALALTWRMVALDRLRKALDR